MGLSIILARGNILELHRIGETLYLTEISHNRMSTARASSYAGLLCWHWLDEGPVNGQIHCRADEEHSEAGALCSEETLPVEAR